MSLRAVLGKELVDHARDRRSILSALMFPVLGPLLFAVSMSMLAGWVDSGKAPKLAVDGIERAPNLVAFLRTHGLEVTPAPVDAEAKVRDGTFDAVLVIGEKFGEEWGDGRAASLQLLSDRSRRSAGAQVDRINLALETYAGFTGAARLLARGVAPELARPLRIDRVDLATPQKLAATLLNMIPLFLVLGAFVGGMNVAIDATAGERERGSLEPLLINPVSRAAIVGGKWLTTVIVAAIGIGLSVVGFGFALSRIPLEVLGVKASFGAVEMLVLLAAVLPLTLFASALQMLVATYARSFKEAQTYLSVVVLLPTIPGMAMTFSPIEPGPALHVVPVLGQHLLVNAILAGEAIGGVSWGLALLGVVVPAALCLVACTRLLEREKIVFGR